MLWGRAPPHLLQRPVVASKEGALGSWVPQPDLCPHLHWGFSECLCLWVPLLTGTAVVLGLGPTLTQDDYIIT